MEFVMRGKMYEDVEIGEVYLSGGRTITESDVNIFACLTGDMNPLHTNEEYARTQTVFGKRVAHGLLGLSIMAGMIYQMGFNEGTTIAFLESVDHFKAPIMIGDTVYTKVTVTEKRLTSKPGRGIVKYLVELCNQDDKVLVEQIQTVMIKANN